MKKMFVSLGLVTGLVCAGSSAFAAEGLAGSSEQAISPLPAEEYVYTSKEDYTSPVDGRGEYGRWSIISNDGSAKGAIYENCNRSWNLRGVLNASKGAASQDYWMSKGCQYKIWVKSNDGTLAKGFIRNIK